MSFRLKNYRSHFIVPILDGELLIEKIWDDEEECFAIKVSRTFEILEEDGTSEALCSPSMILGYESEEERDEKVDLIIDEDKDEETIKMLEGAYTGLRKTLEDQFNIQAEDV